MSARPLDLVGRAHGRLVHSRRTAALAAAIAPLIEPGSTVLDVGCGDGGLAAQLIALRPMNVTGLDVFVRPGAAIPVQAFDGRTIPLPDRSVDDVMMVDVLHHTDDPMILLREAARVARRAVILKDHRMSRPLSGPTLRLMDWVGNKPHGVALPYNYWPERRWRKAWDELGLRVDHYQTRLNIYPGPARWVFECGLHFLARLVPGATS